MAMAVAIHMAVVEEQEMLKLIHKSHSCEKQQLASSDVNASNAASVLPPFAHAVINEL